MKAKKQFAIITICALLAVLGRGVRSTVYGTSIERVDASSAQANGGPVVVDHTSLDISQIPDAWIDQVKTMTVQLVGESHSQQLKYGLELLEGQDAKFKVQLASSPGNFDEPDALHVFINQSDVSGGGWAGAYVGEQHYWSYLDARTMTENTAQHFQGISKPLRASIWIWCTTDVIRDNGVWNEQNTDQIVFNDERRDAYLSSIRRFNTNFPGTTFVYVTSVTDAPSDYYIHTGGGWRVTKYNEDIRQAAIADGGVLFDQADIENWNVDNTEQRIDYWDDGGVTRTLYLRHHDYDANDHGHTNEALCLRKAKAFWWMMARLAGWSGLGESQKTASAVTAAYGDVVTYTIVVQNLSAPLTATVALTDVVPSGLLYVPGTLTASAGSVDDTAAPTLTWTGVLSPTPAVTVTYAATVDTAAPQPIANTAVISALGYQAITRTATVLVNARKVYLPLVLR